MIFQTKESFNTENLKRITGKQYDAIICGGGTAGLVAAVTLLEKGKTVALIEAGPFSLFSHVTNSDMRFQPSLTRSIRKKHEYNQTLPNGDQFGPNLSCLGGRGMFWNGAAPRFQEHDFEGWPISYQEMIPFYEWIEKEFRVGHTMGQNNLARSIIEKINDNGKMQAVPAPFAYNDTKEFDGMIPSGVSSALSLFFRNTSDKERFEAIDILTGTFVNEIIHNHHKASGVRVKPPHLNEQLELKANHIILACGGIESIKLVANSNIDDPYSRVGVGLQEHLFYRSFWNGKNLYDPQKRESAAVFVPSLSQKTEQVEIHAPGNYLFAMDNEVKWQPKENQRYEVMMRSFAATQKTDNNRVTFTDNTLGNSNVVFTRSNRDELLMKQMKQTVHTIGETLDLNLVKDGYARIGGSYHEACGLDMGTDPKQSVTDKNGRIHTMDNLYVVDAASFPVIGATNPHLTIAAISRKNTLNIN